MQHHETPTARALKLTVHMVAVLFGSHTFVNRASRKALVSRGLAVVAGKGITLTDSGRQAVDKIDGEVMDEQARRAAVLSESHAGADCPILAQGGCPKCTTVTPEITVELPSGESLAIPSVVLDQDDESPVPVPRTTRARDVKPGMTIGLVEHDAPMREVIVTDVRWIGSEVTISAGSTVVTTEALTLFRLLNDGSLFECEEVPIPVAV
ncbi:hypothetical protein GCM10009836_52090 [Pseudonocardia ailaonensis]|uniref:Hedgehog/Intein (Hint) domain-containing protein n=1 Tax=Pseudonocardia ailaonensis TaxID=367279 RepID=A0ABN2NHF4_9PSEU